MKNIYILIFISALIACSNTMGSEQKKVDEITIYFNSEHDLNKVYMDIKNYIRDNKVELKYLVDTQRAWLKKEMLSVNLMVKILMLKTINV